MDVKTMLNNLIDEEFTKIEQAGEKIKLKSLAKKRILYTLIFGAIFVVFTAIHNLEWAFIDMIVYFLFMYRTNNVSVITALAKKSPDTPISDIIKGDMK